MDDAINAWPCDFYQARRFAIANCILQIPMVLFGLIIPGGLPPFGACYFPPHEPWKRYFRWVRTGDQYLHFAKIL